MPPTKPLYWTDAHFCGLRSQTNVYSLSKITSKDKLPKLLAACVDGHFISVEYQKFFNKYIPITREDVLFTSSESGGNREVVSIDVISENDSSKSCGAKRTAVGVTYLKLGDHFEEKPQGAFLDIHILQEDEDSPPLNNIMDAINQSHVQHLRLGFIPFKLTHYSVCDSDKQWFNCFLLSGNDHKIHMYKEDVEGNFHVQPFEDVQKYFPEFQAFESCVTQMEIKETHDGSLRLTALGFQNGLVSLTVVNSSSKEILHEWTTEFDSIITSLHLFHQHTNVKPPDFVKKASAAQSFEHHPFNLLVSSAIDPAAVFQDVLENGLTKSQILPQSNSQDIVLCSCVVDIDFDGENEVLIGTYGQVLLAYKFVYEKPQIVTSTPYASPMPIPMTNTPIDHDRFSKHHTSSDQDARRRHKSMAAAFDNTNENDSKIDKQDEGAIMEGSLKDIHISRLVRSQENLAFPSPKSIYFVTPDHPTSNEFTLPHLVMQDSGEYPCYRLTWSRQFCDPVMGLLCVDMMEDGILDLVVLTLKGLHVLQPNLKDVANLLLERLRHLTESSTEET